MVNGVGFGQNVDPRLLLKAQSQNNKVPLETQIMINANKDFDRLEKSPLPDKTGMNVGTAVSLTGVGLMAIGLKKLSNKNFVKEALSGLKGHVATFVGGLKDGFRGKFGYDKLKAVKDIVVDNGAKVLKKLNSLPAPIKLFAAVASGLVIGSRIYKGGTVDGQHNAINGIAKAEVMTKMNNQLASLNKVV